MSRRKQKQSVQQRDANHSPETVLGTGQAKTAETCCVASGMSGASLGFSFPRCKARTWRGEASAAHWQPG